MSEINIGHVTGQTATKIINNAPVTFVSKLSQLPPAVQDMRNKMPPSTYDTLDWLMEKANFSPDDLFNACRYKALVADGALVRKSKLTWMDYLLAAGYLVPAAVMLPLYMVAMALDAGSKIIVIGNISVLMFCIYFTVVVFVRPHLTAHKVMHALKLRESTL